MDILTEAKTCTRCKQEKSLDAFHRSTKRGTISQCKACRAEIAEKRNDALALLRPTPAPVFLPGQKVDFLTIIRRIPFTVRQGAYWLCKCVCGKECQFRQRALLLPGVHSCGCRKGFKHGHTKNAGETKTFCSWRCMRARCSNPHNRDYKHYGGRGIKVCERWSDFASFLADMGERPEGATLDRKNSDGDYEPSNCQWSDVFAQNNNRRNVIKKVSQ